MTRDQLEHLIRAAAAITGEDELVVVGSQAILASHPDAPASLLTSVEADLYPKHRPDRADLIDGSIGELSPFHETFGYYAQGVGPGTAVLPIDWEQRAVAIRTAGTAGATAWCPEAHDLVLSKIVAGREKDLAFLREALACGLVVAATMDARVSMLPVDDDARARVRARIARASSEAG